MENFVTVLIPLFLGILLMRVILMPLRWIIKLSVNVFFGFLCLWLLNTTAEFTGILFPINGATVLTAGTLGLPGIGILALLAVLG